MFRVHHAIWISLLCLAACGGGGVDGPSDDDAPGVGSWLATSGRGRALTAGAGADGSAYLAGSFAGISTFGEDGEPGQTTLDSVGLDDALLARYAPDGTLLWAQLIARGDGSNTIRALAVLPGGGRRRGGVGGRGRHLRVRRTGGDPPSWTRASCWRG